MILYNLRPTEEKQEIIIEKQIWKTLFLCDKNWNKFLSLSNYPDYVVCYNVISVEKIDTFREEWKEFFVVVSKNYKWDLELSIFEIELQPKKEKVLVGEEEKLFIYYKRYLSEGIANCDTCGNIIGSVTTLHKDLNQDEKEKFCKLWWKVDFSVLNINCSIINTLEQSYYFLNPKVLKLLKNWKHKVVNSSVTESYILKVWEKEIYIVSWAVFVNALLEYFWINPYFKNLKVRFSWILKPGDEVELKKEWDKYIILKDSNEILVLTENNDKKNFEKYYEEFLSMQMELDKKEIYKVFSGWYDNKTAGWVWTVFRRWKIKLDSGNISYYYKKEWEISEEDMFLWAYEFDSKNPSIFLLEMIAQTALKTVANISENSEKWKILSLKDFEFQLLKNVEKSGKLTIVWKIRNIWEKDVTIWFDIMDWDWDKVATGTISVKYCNR